MAEYTLFAYDYNGKCLGEIKPSSLRCSWIISDVGQMEFSVPISQADETILRFGNFVYMRHSSLPAWGGVIVPDRKWSADYVTCTALDGAYQFKRRVSGIETFFGTSGKIAQRLIERANLPFDARLREGSIFEGGTPVGIEAQYSDFLSILKEACTGGMLKGEFVTFPQVDRKNKLYFNVNIYDGVGANDSFAFQEGVNLGVESVNLVETGTIANDLFVFGTMANGDIGERSHVTEFDSVYQYGMTQASVQEDSDSENRLRITADAFIRDHAFHRGVVIANVLDVGNAWQHVSIGNKVNVLVYSVGFKGGGNLGLFLKKRIDAAEYNGTSNTVKVIFKGD